MTNAMLRTLAAAAVVATIGAAPRANAQSVSFDQVAALLGMNDSYAAWGDYDNDGDLDMVMIGYGDGWGPMTRLYRNDGGTLMDMGGGFAPVMSGAALWADYDRDGRLDSLLVGDGATHLYHNDGGDMFSEVPTPFPGLNWYGGAAWGDYNNDGYPDLVIAGTQGYDPQTAITKLYQNVGGVFVDTQAPLPGVFYGNLAWGDADNDGRLDLAVCGATAGGPVTAVLRNNSGTFVDIQAGMEGVQNCSLAWADYDGDGRQDLAVSGSPMARVYHNNGGSFSDIGAPLVGASQGSVAWGDADADGRPDLLVTGVTGPTAVTALYLNTPGGFVETPTGLPGVERGGAAWGDFDGDGRQDLILHGDIRTNDWTGPMIATLYRNSGGTLPPDMARLSVHKLGAGTGAVISYPAGIDCGANCRVTLPNGTAIELVAQPAPGSAFLGWEGACSGTGQCLPTLNGEVSVNAVFGIAGLMRWLTVMADGPGQVTSAPPGIDCRGWCGWYFSDSSSVVLTANPDPGSYALWSGACAGVATTCTVRMDMDQSVSVSFVPGLLVSVTKTGNGRIVSQPPGIDCGSVCAQGFPYGPVILSALADPGWVFAGWSGACSVAGDCQIPGPDSASVSAQFDSIGSTYTVTVSTSGTGTVTSSGGGIDCGSDCSEAYPSGTMITLTAAAPPGYTLQAWGGDCSGRGACTLTMNGPKTVTATFAVAPFAESVSLAGVRGGRAVWGDYDNDGDLDAAVTSAYGPERPTIYRNDNGILVDSGIVLNTGTGFAAWGDYDNDGDLDLIAGGWVASPPGYVTKLFRTDGGTLVEVPAPFVGVSMGAQAAWGDYDNDGDLDVVLCGYDNHSFVTKLYRNDHGTFVDTNTPLVGVYYCDVAWGDYNSDGYVDLAITGSTVSGLVTMIYRNDGGMLVNSGIPLPGGMNGSLAWADYDGDGDLDLSISGDSGNGLSTKVYRNDGGAFVDSGANLVGVYNGSATWIDYDADGHPDLLVTGTTSDGQRYWPVTKLYRNDGGSFVEQFSGLPDLYASGAAAADYDGDGRLDVLMMGVYPERNLDLYTAVYRNVSPSADTAPQPPSNSAAILSDDGVRLSWGAAADAETPSAGLSYNVRVGTTPGGSEVASAMADPATGFRRVAGLGNAGPDTSFLLRGLAPGRYYWAVQAIDTSFAGSAFSDGGELVVPTPGVTIAVDDVTLTEGNTGTTPAIFTVTLSAPAAQVVEVAFATQDGTATAASDYTSQTGVLTFAPGENSKTVTVAVSGDSNIERDETFVLRLSNPVGATLARDLGTATIVSDEPPPASTTEAVVWTHKVGVRATGNNLRKQAPTRWGNSGAVSTRAIVLGDGYVELVASETNKGRMLGLSHGDTDAGFMDIDFAVHLAADASLRVYEGGVLQGTFGTYATGDVLRVAVVNGVVTYGRNGVTLYASTQTPTYPLLVDAALRSNRATLHDVVISGSLITLP